MMPNPFPAKERPLKLAQDLLKKALRTVRDARERSDVKPDTDLASMFDVVEEYLEGISGILKEREKVGDFDGE